MTDGKFKTSKNALEVLSKASELASKFTAVSNILVIAAKLTASFSCVGAVFGLIEGVVPDENHKEILHCFEKLNNKVDQVRDDIKKLEQTIKWENTELQYGYVVGRINLGMQFCHEIGKREGKEEKMNYQQRLKEVCADQNFTLAMNALLEGMAGKGVFRKSILDEFYSETNGDREKISALATRLLQLVCGGMMVIATYETMMRGKEGAEEETERYDGQLKEVFANVQSVIDDCVENFKENILIDLNTFLDKGGSNEGLATEVSDFIRDKYDWLENFCLVYNDPQEIDQHCFSGDEVHSLHRNEKCGIVFYRKKVEPPMYSGRYDEALKIVENGYGYDAEGAHKVIVAGMNDIRIGWTGCAVIARSADIRNHGTFSTKIVAFPGHYRVGRVGIDTTFFLLLK